MGIFDLRGSRQIFVSGMETRRAQTDALMYVCMKPGGIERQVTGNSLS